MIKTLYKEQPTKCDVLKKIKQFLQTCGSWPDKLISKIIEHFMTKAWNSPHTIYTPLTYLTYLPCLTLGSPWLMSSMCSNHSGVSDKRTQVLHHRGGCSESPCQLIWIIYLIFFPPWTELLSNFALWQLRIILCLKRNFKVCTNIGEL